MTVIPEFTVRRGPNDYYYPNDITLILADGTEYYPAAYNAATVGLGPIGLLYTVVKPDGTVWLVGGKQTNFNGGFYDVFFYTYTNGVDFLGQYIRRQQGPLHVVTENDEFWMSNVHQDYLSPIPDGVIVYNAFGQTIDSYSPADGFPSAVITDIAEASDGSMIVATPCGLYRIQRPLKTAVEEDAAADETGPTQFSVPYPNPFNAAVTIPFTVGEAGEIECAVYSISGQRVRTLVSGRLQLGAHRVVWDGHDDAGNAVSSGVYLVRLVAGNRTSAVRVVLMK